MSAAQQATPMNKVRFRTNIPEIIAVTNVNGTVVTSKPEYGGYDQVRFNTVDGRVMYLAPAVADKIKQAGVTPGELFSITKREVERGNWRGVEYEIGDAHNNRATAGTSSHAPAAHASTAPPQAAKQAMTSHRTNEAAPRPPEDLTTQLQASITHVQQAKAQALTAAAAVAPAGNLEAMISAHLRAIDVAAAAEAYAKDKGLAIRYTAEDVRSIAATMFINSQGGRR